ncbi:formyltransferase family protein [uncultured Chryseobacterium sp.]|uniref:methionyl-tRNA formyltransferase n=1 Tax=uncultured Chryseobacterium sp. TaxID=259322 RepID=UPI0025F0E1FF|nr:formyltransferase family protein [uncultured Chryseobacterium sp.]
MKLVIFGEDAFTAIVLESLINEGYEILAVFSPIYKNNIYKRLELTCIKNAISFELTSDFRSIDFINKIIHLQPDVICICHFQKLISNEIIKIPKFGCLNLHPSLLPEYRGMAPQHWPIINGENKTGITVHFVDDGIDTGNIIVQKELDIKSSEYVFELQNRFKEVYKYIFAEALRKIEKTDLHVVQSHLPGSYYGRLKLSDCIIKDNMGIISAYNLIRGVSYPYFGARYKDHIFWKAELFSTDISKEIKFEIKDKEGYLFLKDGILKITKLEKYER